MDSNTPELTMLKVRLPAAEEVDSTMEDGMPILNNSQTSLSHK